MTKKNRAMAAAVSMRARLIAEKKPAPQPVEAADVAKASDRAVRESRSATDRPTTAFRVGDSGVPYASGADLEPDGSILGRLEGRPEQGEQGVGLAASHVIERLNAKDGRWGAPQATSRDAQRERGVDAVAFNPAGGLLQMQVTRAEQVFWKRLGTEGVVELRLSVDDAVEALWKAIKGKATTANRTVHLILDAANVPQFAFGEVIHRFRQLRGQDASAAGWAEVWMAGPTGERTFRLDDMTR